MTDTLKYLNKYRDDARDGDLWTDPDDEQTYVFVGDHWIATEPRTEEDIQGEWDFENSSLNLYHNTSAPLALFTPQPRTFVLCGSEGQELVTVNLDDGDVTFSEEYEPTESARAFWESIGAWNSPKTLNEFWEEYCEMVQIPTNEYGESQIKDRD